MLIYFDEDSAVDQKTAETMTRAASLALQGEGLDMENATLSVSFVDAEEIRQLNHDYRGNDSVTDVLSFPSYEDLSEVIDGTELALGDVVICTQRAHEQAEEFGHSYERELIYLFVHSVFHLLGFDHMEEDERRKMREKEEAVMTALNITREA